MWLVAEIFSADRQLAGESYAERRCAHTCHPHQFARQRRHGSLGNGARAAAIAFLHIRAMHGLHSWNWRVLRATKSRPNRLEPVPVKHGTQRVQRREAD